MKLLAQERRSDTFAISEGKRNASRSIAVILYYVKSGVVGGSQNNLHLGHARTGNALRFTVGAKTSAGPEFGAN